MRDKQKKLKSELKHNNKMIETQKASSQNMVDEKNKVIWDLDEMW